LAKYNLVASQLMSNKESC